MRRLSSALAVAASRGQGLCHRRWLQGLAEEAAVEAAGAPGEAHVALTKVPRRRTSSLLPEPVDEAFGRLVLRQEKRERDAINDAVLTYRKLVKSTTERGATATLPPARHLLNRWFPPLEAAIKATKDEIDLMVAGKGVRAYGHFINVLTAEKLAVISLHSVLSLLCRGGSDQSQHSNEGVVLTSRVVNHIADAVQAQVNLAKLDMHARQMKRKAPPQGKSPVGIAAANILAARANVRDAKWDPALKAKIGGLLMRLVIETATVKVPSEAAPGTFEFQPAFEMKLIQDPSGRQLGVIQWHPDVHKSLKDAIEYRSTLNPTHQPMLAPPRPWDRYDRGGYYLQDSIIMRGSFGPMGPAKAQLEALRQEQTKADQGVPGAGFPKLLEALNVLGRTQWRINTDVLAVVEQVWEEGGGIAEVPPKKNIPIPSPPRIRFVMHSAGRQLVCHGSKPMSQDSIDFRIRLKKIKQQNRDLHSLRADFMLKLGVAQNNRSETAIFFPHNIDFRGRAYTMHPNLSHLGSDLCRGLLKFAQTKPLGEHGLKWLRIQVANVFGGGVDKLPLPEREQFIVDNMHLVSDSATNPLRGQRWWLKAEDPWQCLAGCMELHKASLLSDPRTFESSLPVHQDGSCNGLQHYAALARDEEGGRAVNLLPSDEPADVYKGIAVLVKEAVMEDMSSSTSQSSAEAARLVEHVDRKLVKQTVMTSVYGVTFVGARDQIWNRLRERKAFSTEEEYIAMAMYAARKVIEGLGNMFGNAKAVMDWLNECAREIAHHEESVRWRTPVGLPVVQPYRRHGARSVHTVLQTFTVPSASDQSPVIKTKQRTAFPPNYIHSLDAAHMMLTACACGREGIEFAGVHDSYWTHAGTVDGMSRILREQFVKLHSEPLLQQLYHNFQQQYPGITFPPPPQAGTLNLEDVLRSQYFFS